MKTIHVFILSAGWIAVTFALHCWVLYALAGLPDFELARSDSQARMATLNRIIVGTNETKVMGVLLAGMGPKGMATDLPYRAYVAHKDSELQLLGLARSARVAGRRATERLWLFWALVAFTPPVGFLLFHRSRAV